MPILNSVTIGDRSVHEDQGAGGVNWFLTSTGAGRYGHGAFLMDIKDYEALSTASEDGSSVLVMGDHRGPKLNIPVYVSSAMPYSFKAGSNESAGIVLVRVLDKRHGKDAAVTESFNVQNGFAYDGTTPEFQEETLNGSGEYEWADLLSGAGLPSIESPPTWKPRNVIFDSWQLHRAVDWVAAELFLVAGWDDATSEFSFHEPGVRTSANTTLFEEASGLLTAGGAGKRSTRSLPKQFAVQFKASVAAYDSNRIYTKTVDTEGKGSIQPLHVGGYIATKTSSGWAGQSTLDAVAADLAARAYRFLAVQPALYEFKGIVPFKPDGMIREILWAADSQSSRTTILHGCRFDWAASSNGGLSGFADPGIPGAMPRQELPSDQLIVGLGGMGSSISPAGTRYIWGGTNSFWAKITGNASLSANKWKYAWSEQVRTASGWAAVDGGRSGTTSDGYALNSIEASNDGSGVEGNSIDVDGTDFPDGFEMQPVRGEPIVRMWPETADDGTATYTFEYVSAVDGTCEAEE